MDKTEYKIRAEEIKSLIKAQRFADAVKIADTIDWKGLRVSVCFVPSVIYIK